MSTLTLSEEDLILGALYYLLNLEVLVSKLIIVLPSETDGFAGIKTNLEY